MAAHPAAYPGLWEWLETHGDDDVKAAIAARAAAIPPPPPPPVEPVAPSIPAPPPPPAAAAAEETAVPHTEGVSMAAASVATSTDAAASSTNANANTWKILAIFALVAALVGGGWFAAQALTDDDEGDIPTSSVADKNDDDSGDGFFGGSDDDDNRSSSQFCTDLKGLRDTAGRAPTSRNLDDMQDYARDLADKAPREISSQLQVMADYLEATGDPSKVGSLNSEMSRDYVDAGVDISKYVAANCPLG